MVYQRMKHLLKAIVILFSLFCPLPLWAKESSTLLTSDHLSFLWGLPFMGVLLSIALFPLFVPSLWHRHFGKISALWSLGFLIPCWMVHGPDSTLYICLHTLLLEYLPFIILLCALFTTTGGIQIKGGFRGTPLSNTLLLTLGTLMASFIGTTGASMLLIHPLIQANASRHYKTHTIIFFIFLVSNIGGILTPLGDPPLFLGFLRGIPFFWPLHHLFIPLLIIGIPLIFIFYGIDFWLFKKEPLLDSFTSDSQHLSIIGSINFLFLAGILGAVIMSGIWQSGIELKINGISLKLENCLRDLILIFLSLFSLYVSPSEARKGNHFNWAPMLEVAKIFLAIFITAIPVLSMLEAGSHGPFGHLLDLTMTAGHPNNAMYFWLTGILSSFLDNAPTYLVFFSMAGGDADILACVGYKTLMAISCGAVFMGAMTYIGNAPNFMVKAVAEQEKIKMPSFFGYLAWSIPLLGGMFFMLTLVYFM